MPSTYELAAELAAKNAKRARLVAEAEGLNARGDMTPGEQTRFSNILRACDKLDLELSETRTAWETSLRKDIDTGRVTTETAQFGSGSPSSPQRDEFRTYDTARRQLDAVRSAYPELGNDGAIEGAVQILEREKRGDVNRGEARDAIANHIAITGTPEYARAFAKVMADPMNGHRRFDQDELRAWQNVASYQAEQNRAMAEGSNTTGGYMVPTLLDPSIVLTNAGTVSPIRRLATIKTITSAVYHGVTSAGVTSEFIAEATEVSDASPSLGTISITAVKADSYLQASLELVQDTILSGEITKLLTDAKDRLEASAFVTGSGSGAPRGIVTACSGGANSIAGSSGAAGAADLVAADIFAVANALPARFRQNGASWLASYPIINKIRQLNIATSQTSTAFWADFADDQPSKLIGFPIFEASDFDQTIVSGSNDDVLLFGDLSEFYIVDRVGMTIAMNPMVLGANRRPTAEVGWLATWRVGSDSAHSGSARLLRL